MMREINFDGLIGPSHNYAALSLGNLASARHGGATSRPRAAALQGMKQAHDRRALPFFQALDAMTDPFAPDYAALKKALA
jgi:succinylarginine dihydrolase